MPLSFVQLVGLYMLALLLAFGTANLLDRQWQPQPRTTHSVQLSKALQLARSAKVENLHQENK